MKKYLLFGLIAILLLINGCEVAPTDKPYIKEAKLSPIDYIDYSDTTTKIVYTVENPLKISFNGKVIFEYDEKCLYMQKEQDIFVNKQSTNSKTIIVKKDYNIKDECYGEQQIILRLSEEDEKLIYGSKELILKLIQ